MKKIGSKRYIVVLSILFIISLIMIIPPKNIHEDGVASYEVKYIEEKETRKKLVGKYIDDLRNVVKPLDKGYAIKVTELDGQGRGIAEYFYNADMEPAKQGSGYYSIKREYDAKGRQTSFTYADIDGEAVMLSSGYAKVRRIYDEYDRLAEEWYYDTSDVQVAHKDGYYGVRYQYFTTENDEKPSTQAEYVIYLDKDGSIGARKGIYSAVRRSFDEAGNVLSESYLDQKLDPTVNDIGVYEAFYRYDEHKRKTHISYLDSLGRDMNCDKGYSSVIKYYYKDGTVSKEYYHDADGKPAVLQHGESGVIHKNGTNIYLNKDFKERFRPNELLRNHPIIVLALTVLIFALSSRLNKKGTYIFVALYVAFIIYMTLLDRENVLSYFKGWSKESFLAYLKYYNLRKILMENVFLFVPLGIFAYKLRPSIKIVFIGIFLSVAIELSQLIFRLGVCELDDIVANSFGMLLGMLLYKTKNDIS